MSVLISHREVWVKLCKSRIPWLTYITWLTIVLPKEKETQPQQNMNSSRYGLGEFLVRVRSERMRYV